MEDNQVKNKIRDTKIVAFCFFGMAFFGSLLEQGWPIVVRTFMLSFLFGLLTYSFVWFLVYSIIHPIIFSSSLYFAHKKREAEMKWVEEQLDSLRMPSATGGGGDKGMPTLPPPPARRLVENAPERVQNRSRTGETVPKLAEPFRNDEQWGKLPNESADMHVKRLKRIGENSSLDEERFIAKMLAAGVTRTTIRRVVGGNTRDTSRLIEEVSRSVNITDSGVSFA